MNVKRHKSELKQPMSIATVCKYTTAGTFIYQKGTLIYKTCITFNTGETEFRHMTHKDYVKYQKWLLGPRKSWDGSL